MTLAITLLLIGGIMVYSGFKGQTIKGVVLGETDPTPKPPAPDYGTSAPGEGDSTGIGGPGGAPGGPLGPLSGAHGQALLHNLAKIAHEQFGLRIGQFGPGLGKKFPESSTPVTPVHAPGSYHYKGRAFDASGSQAQEEAYAHYVQSHYGPQITELFWCGPNAVNIKNGKPTSCPGGHTDHVHTAI